MALIGGQIPVSGYQTPDYSGASQAAGALGAMPSQMVTGFVGQVQDYLKQQKDQAKTVDTASRIAGLIASKAPDLIPGIGELKNILDNQENPLSRRVEAASSLFDLMKVGYEVNTYNNQNAIANRQAAAASSQAGSNENRNNDLIGR
tara:strand:+ start:195 stop:635 length:441 start_codon:yes stop_codon:yes gene_type:complete